MKLLNVKLEDSDVAKVAALRGGGVNISDLVRHAIRGEYERRNGKRRPGDIEKLLASIYAAHPIPPGVRRPKVDLRDRHAVRRAIAARVARKGRK
jgi:hypothetical protein